MDTTTSHFDSAARPMAAINSLAESVRLRTALREWKNLLGVENVLCSDHILDKYATTTLPEGNRALAVLRPESTAEVGELVMIASKHRIPIYPISRGKNWGYGDACPVTHGQVIVDLRRMNRILEVNSELAYAVIEPGVTQGQLATYLRETGSGLMLDVTGAGPDASIVGNTLERGFGHTPYGDHFAHSCGLEVVLASGEVLNTGFGGFANAQAAHVFPWGLGPWLDGLFTQSNFGVVTKLCIHLMPRAPCIEAFAMRVKDADHLGEVVERLRDLRLSETVRSTVHIANDLRVLSSRERFQKLVEGAASPLPAELRTSLRRSAGLGHWNVFGGLYAPRELRRGLRRVVRSAFRKTGKVLFFNRRKIGHLRRLAGLLQPLGLAGSLREVAENAGAAFDLLEGIPTPQHLAGAAWRRSNAPSSGEVTSHGLIWASPVVPLTAAHVRGATQIVEDVLHAHGFDAPLTLSATSPRAMCCVASIHFDKQSAEETARAKGCYELLMERLVTDGYIPYRVGVQSMRQLMSHATSHWKTVKRLRDCLDPRNIIAPGRYE